MTKRTTRVLSIEGDADAASLIDVYLAGAPGDAEILQVTHASRLSSACQLLARQEFDAVLLDLALPQTTGLDALHKIAGMKPSLPVIVLTGSKDEYLAVRAVKEGAQDYFVKGSPDCCFLKRAIRWAIEKKLATRAFVDVLAADRCPMIVLDEAGVVRFANQAVKPVLGQAPEELLDKALGRELPDGRVERPIVWRGEQARLVSLSGAGRSTDGASGELSVVEEKNNFLGRISHELRNTLATMKTATYCLKEGSAVALTQQQLALIDMISRNIDRQTRIVENILDLARFRSGTLKVQLRRADAATIISDLAAEFRLSRGAQMLQVRVDGDLPSIVCDPDLIAQVLRNLLDNAARHAKARIDIEASRSGSDFITVSVSDDGAGIPAEHLEGLFTQFQQLDAPMNGNGRRGTGLGLAICREIIEAHHGRIKAENAENSGARFSFKLPVGNGDESAATPRVFASSVRRRPAYPPKKSNLLHK